MNSLTRHHTAHDYTLTVFGLIKDTNSEKLSHVLQVLHSTGGSIRKLKVYRCDMKQVIAYVTPFYSTLEEITLYIAGFTQECVDTMCDGIIQTCHKISSQEVTYGEHEHTAESIVYQPQCVCLPLLEAWFIT